MDVRFVDRVHVGQEGTVASAWDRDVRQFTVNGVHVYVCEVKERYLGDVLFVNYDAMVMANARERDECQLMFYSWAGHACPLRARIDLAHFPYRLIAFEVFRLRT